MQSMEMLDSEGKPYNFWGSKNYVMCSSDHHWRNLISETVAKVVDYLKVDAVYIDEFGFGSRTSHYKKCTNGKHSHSLENFDLQIGEKETLKEIKSNLNEKKLKTQIYIEETPFHSCFSEINGSLSTSAIKCAKQHSSSSIPIILNRFISPHHRTYQIITEYTMANEDILSNNKTIIQDLQQIKRAILISFWNGCGIYVPKNLRFYDKSVVEIIESCNRNFLRFVEFYVNGNASPLVIGDVEKGREQVLGHKFWLVNEKDSGNGNEEKEGKEQNEQKYILNVLNLSQEIQRFTICKCLTNNEAEITIECKCEMKQEFAMNPMSLGVYYHNDGYIEIACL